MITSSPLANTNPSHMLMSCACSQSALESREFQDWVERVVKGTWPEHEGDSLWMHRKVWEWCYICQALYERELLKPDIRGLGFAVGKEPLSAIFASHGCNIVATDLDTEKVGNDSEWIETNQHAANLKDLNKAQLCPDDIFNQRVSFRFADMNHIGDDLTGFDFIWSSCSMEHLGSLRHGKEFVYNSGSPVINGKSRKDVLPSE